MLNVSKQNNGYVVSFEDDVNRFNTLNSNEVADILSKFIIQPNSNLILDLKGIKFIDTSGFSTISSLLDSAKTNNCKLRFKNIDDEVMELVDLMEMREQFEVYEN